MKKCEGDRRSDFTAPGLTCLLKLTRFIFYVDKQYKHFFILNYVLLFSYECVLVNDILLKQADNSGSKMTYINKFWLVEMGRGLFRKPQVMFSKSL